MSEETPVFNQEEIKEIKKYLGPIIESWAVNLIKHIIDEARSQGVSTVYMNTSETVRGNIGNEEKNIYFYEKLPQQMGFVKERAELREDPEIYWSYHLNKTKESSNLYNLLILAQRTILYEEIPVAYRNNVIQMFGRKKQYTIEQLKQVLKQVENKKAEKFFYSWGKKWTGGQRFMERFNPKLHDDVVTQHLTPEIRNFILQNPTLTKFFGFILSQMQHGFSSQDTIGFGLIHKVNKDVWIINEIQTDVINQYKKVISYSQKSNKISLEALLDLLFAANKKNWIPYVQNNEAFRNSLLDNPRQIDQLCTDDINIDKWMKEQRGENQGQNLQNELVRNLVNARNNGKKIIRI